VARVQIALAAAGADAALQQAKQGNVDLGEAASESLLRSVADRLVADGRIRDADDVVSAALAKHPDSAALHEMQGLLLVRLGRDGEARGRFEKSIELDASNSRARAGLAGLSVRAGDTPRAIELFDEAAKANPNDTAPAYAAAQLVLRAGDPTAARQRLEAIVQRDPGHAGARNDLAWLLAQQPDPDLERALALAEEAHRIDASPEIADTLGWVYLQRGETERAAELFQGALEKRPESQSIRYHLGVALGRQGERQRAIETLRQAVEAGSFAEAEEARNEIARLEKQ
jgi:tetratricopeptide (TPR) repeat protein